MVEKPKLLIGWEPDAAPKAEGDAPAQPNLSRPIYLCGEGLRSHIAIIGQSGSGKSFSLGRLIEEIVARTRGRVSILDPNSDFARFSEVDQAKWRPNELRGRSAAEDSRGEFLRRWEQNTFVVLSQQNDLGAELRHPCVTPLPISVSWKRLDSGTKKRYLGIPPTSAPGEAMVVQWIHLLRGSTNELRDLSYQTLKLVGSQLPAAMERMVGKTSDLDLLESLLSKEGARSVHARCGELRELGIWDVAGDAGVGEAFEALGRRKPDAGGDSVCLDLGSLAKPEAVLMATHVALANLWRGSRLAWMEALQSPGEYDERPPVFVVIDEAHNLCAREPRTAIEHLVREAIARIATEGRKLGLFLVLATQRPGLVDPTVLSQCDSLCLHRLNNEQDAEYLTKTLGFLNTTREEVAKLQKGEALIAGQFVQGTDTVRVMIASRRTKEGGRSIGKGWLQDPSP